MKKEIIIIILVILAIGLIIFIPKSCNKPVKIKQDNGWEILKKEMEKEIEVKDSIYLDLKQKTQLKIKQLEKERIAQEQKYQKQLNDLKKKYDKEYSKVTATPIDSTISISTRFLSEKVDYSKFQK
jgi:predicted small secreted protein